MAERLGFIGLGILGQPMASNLLQAGYSLTVFNRSRAAVDALVQAGAKPAGSPREVAGQSDIVMTAVTDASALSVPAYLPLSRAVCERNIIMREGINSPELASPAGPFSHVVKAGGFLYISGQIAQNPQTGHLVEQTKKAHLLP